MGLIGTEAIAWLPGSLLEMAVNFLLICLARLVIVEKGFPGQAVEQCAIFVYSAVIVHVQVSSVH